MSFGILNWRAKSCRRFMSGPSWYLAARFSRRFELQGVRADLHRSGHIVTSRWIDDDEESGDNSGAAIRDIEDIELADGLMVFTDEPRCATRGGKHFEAGHAYSLGKRLVGIGTPGHVFHYLPEFQWFPDWETAKGVLLKPPRISLRNVWSASTLSIDRRYRK